MRPLLETGLLHQVTKSWPQVLPEASKRPTSILLEGFGHHAGSVKGPGCGLNA